MIDPIMCLWAILGTFIIIGIIYIMERFSCLYTINKQADLDERKQQGLDPKPEPKPFVKREGAEEWNKGRIFIL